MTGDDSAGGSLPITGTNPGLVAAVGAPLLAAGIAVWLPARRRTRFTR